MSTSIRLITYEDFLMMPENKLEEIVKGESRVMPQASDRNGYLLHRLARMLERPLPEEKLVVLGAEFGLGIRRAPLFTYRVPDQTVFRLETLRQDRRDKAENDPYIWKVPELLVECLSPSNRKGPVQELIEDYSSIGVPEVWLLDPKKPLLTGYLFQGGRLHEVQQVKDGLISPVRLPGVRVHLKEIWEAFDRGL